MDQVSETAQDLGSFASDVAEAIKERPYTTIAVAGGLAFAIGALWMLRRQQPQSAFEPLLSRLPNLPDTRGLWAGRWR